MRVLVILASQSVSVSILNLLRHKCILSIAPLERYVYAHGWQFGGGLLIYGTATLTNSNVYANQASIVSWLFELSMSFHPAPRWNVTRARFAWQGAGLAVYGMATLTNTNVYSNQATYVRSPFQLFLNFHPSPR